MATRNATSATLQAVTPAGEPPSKPDLDVEDDLGIAMRLQDLATWVCEARSILERVKFFAEHDQVISEKLRQWAIPMGSADWDRAETEGLFTLNCEITGHLMNVQRGIEAYLGQHGSAQ